MALFVSVFFLIVAISFQAQASDDVRWERKSTVQNFESKEFNQYSKGSLQINLNTADKNLLQHLNGVGPKKAQAIIDFRNQNGHFKSAADICKIKGFSKKALDKIIKDKTYVITTD